MCSNGFVIWPDTLWSKINYKIIKSFEFVILPFFNGLIVQRIHVELFAVADGEKFDQRVLETLQLFVDQILWMDPNDQHQFVSRLTHADRQLAKVSHVSFRVERLQVGGFNIFLENL
jgi:hypothetical protein